MRVVSIFEALGEVIALFEDVTEVQRQTEKATGNSSSRVQQIK